MEQTEGVIAQSVNDIHDFDPREAMHAFEDLAKYAQNLLEQPWRKEFHKIKVLHLILMFSFLLKSNIN